MQVSLPLARPDVLPCLLRSPAPARAAGLLETLPLTPPPLPPVPSAVPALHQVSRASNSITVSWPQPDQTNGNILDYQLRYYDQVGRWGLPGRAGGSSQCPTVGLEMGEVD